MRLSGLKNYKNDGTAGSALDRSIRACREAGSDERMSEEARDRVLNATLHNEAGGENLPALFTPTRRLWVAAAAPVLLTMALLVGFESGVDVPPASAQDEPQVAVVKQGDRVRFQIENGSRRHVVYRSTVPDRFEESSAVSVTDGAYEDGLQDQADLVFYRID
jgi:hypothetical protein